MNEVAIIYHENEDLDTALKFYKKALLCMKKRYKNRFQEQKETSKILINIASLYESVSNFPDACKYYHHALDVLYKSRDDENIALTCYERGKVHMSLAHIYFFNGSQPQTACQFELAITQLSKCKEFGLTDPELNELLLEARHGLRSSKSGVQGAYSYQRL